MHCCAFRPVFYMKLLCGYCEVTVRLLCGYCVVAASLRKGLARANQGARVTARAKIHYTEANTSRKGLARANQGARATPQAKIHYTEARTWINEIDRVKFKYRIFLTVDGKNFAPHELHIECVHLWSGQNAAAPCAPMFNIEVVSRAGGARCGTCDKVRSRKQTIAPTRSTTLM